jgi:PhnB protein
MKECMMRLIPYLQFKGECEAAFRVYEACLDGKITFMMRYAEAPQGERHEAAGWGDKIYHVTLVVEDSMLQGADVTPESYQTPQGFSLSLDLQDAGRGERIFEALAQNGTVKMLLQETSWARRFGMLVDRFGVPWLINVGKPT